MYTTDQLPGGIAAAYRQRAIQAIMKMNSAKVLEKIANDAEAFLEIEQGKRQQRQQQRRDRLN